MSLRLAVHQPFPLRLPDRSYVQYNRGDLVKPEHETLVLEHSSLRKRVSRGPHEEPANAPGPISTPPSISVES